jgi:hypothetical protein
MPMWKPTRHNNGEGRRRRRRDEIASCDSTGVVVAARTGKIRCATREVCQSARQGNVEPARASDGSGRWRMGPQYRGNLVTEAEGRGPGSERTHEAARAAGIDDESTNSA